MVFILHTAIVCFALRLHGCVYAGNHTDMYMRCSGSRHHPVCTRVSISRNGITLSSPHQSHQRMATHHTAGMDITAVNTRVAGMPTLRV